MAQTLHIRNMVRANLVARQEALNPVCLSNGVGAELYLNLSFGIGRYFYNHTRRVYIGSYASLFYGLAHRRSADRHIHRFCCLC